MAKIIGLRSLDQLVNVLNDRYGSKKGFLLSMRDAFLAGVLRDKYFQADFKKVNRVVFVCQGNICRSALAEKVMSELSSRPVISFGLNTHSGKSANKRMEIVAKSLGYDLSGHKTTSLQDVEILPDDLLVCMEYEQAKYIIKNNISSNVAILGVCLSKFSSRLPDPYSANENYMRRCAEMIISATAALSNRLDQLQ